MKTKFKLGVIGGSFKSAVGYTHIIASQMDHRFTINSACFSSCYETTIDTIEAWNLQGVTPYRSWLELLESEQSNIDAVLVLTPTPSHYEIVKEAVVRGFPVICEKALTATYEEAAALEELRLQSEGFIAVTHNYTGYPAIREMAEICKLGSIGEIIRVQAEMPQEGFIRHHPRLGKPQPQPWRLSDGQIPGISLDLGTHVFHMIHFLTGLNPKFILAENSNFGFFEDLVDDSVLWARYETAMKSSVWITKSALGHRNGLKISVYGKKGSIEWAQTDAENLSICDEYGNQKIIDRSGDVLVANSSRYNRFKPGHPAGFLEAFANIYFDIADELDFFKNGRQLDADWTYGAKQAAIGLRVLSASTESAAQERWIAI